MLKRTKIYRRVWLCGQHILAFIEEKLGLHKQFESTLDRWKRKGLVREVKLSSDVPRFRKEDIDLQHREMYDDIVLAEPRRGAPQPRRSDSGRPPDRRRLRRLYRWQLRNKPKGPRETYDELITSLRS